MISLHNLPPEGIRHSGESPFLDLGDGIKVEGIRYELFFLPSNNDIYIECKGSGLWMGQCSRCLAPVDLPMTWHTQFLGSHDQTLVTGGEHMLGRQDLDLIYLEASEMNEEKFIFDQFELHKPHYPLCTLECSGLCPQCGKNWNKGPCSCNSHENPNSSALARALEKLKLDFNP